MPTSTAHDRTATPTSPTGALLDLSTRQLQTELLGLAGHIAAAQCRFLQLLGPPATSRQRSERPGAG